MPQFQGNFTLADAADWIGPDLVVSDWITVDQDHVSRFGELTRHDHWLHLNPDRSARESPFGGTIAQGFLLLDYIIYFTDQTGLRPVDSAFNLNYGLDKVRFIQPVPVGSGFRLRDRIGLTDVSPRKDGRTLIKTSHDLEVEGLPGSAVYAEWLSLWTPKSDT